MEHPIWFVKRADPNAVTAVACVFCPEFKALLKIQIPLEAPSGIGFIDWLNGPLSMGDSLDRTVICTFFTHSTEFSHTKFNGLVANQGKVGENLA